MSNDGERFFAKSGFFALWSNQFINALSSCAQVFWGYHRSYYILGVGEGRMINYKMSYLMSGDETEYSIDEVQMRTGMKKEMLMLEIGKVNEVIYQMALPEISMEENVLLIPKNVKKKWLDILFEEKETEVVYTETERQLMIYLLVFMEEEEYSVFHFQEFFSVSKNTILSDLRKLREKISKKQIVLDYSRKRGFVLSGLEITIRSTAYQMLGELVGAKNGTRLVNKGLFTKSICLYADVRTDFSKTIEVFGLSVVPSRFEEMVYFISYLFCRVSGHEITLNQEDKLLLEKLLSYQASNYFLANWTEIKNKTSEAFYFTILFMTVIQGEIQDKSLEFLLECAGDMIHEVERLAAIEFQNYRKLLLDLFYHLVPAYFRIRFHFPLGNVLIDEIKLQYSEIFEITKVALFPLKKLIQQTIPDEEIGYFTILFGGEIRSQKERKEDIQLRALILCPSGISSSLIMKSELQELFPQIDFHEARSVESFKSEGSEAFDMIFSSIPIKTQNRLYVIKPIMTQLEKNMLLRTVQEDFLFPKILIPSVNEIIDIILPHIELKKGVSKEKLYKAVQRKVSKEMKRREDDRPMLSELLTRDMIQLSDEPMNWEQAIEFAAQPLKENGKIESSYVTAMIDKVKDYGPFIHIGKGVALPHARPEDGVNQLGMSLLKVKDPVLLLDDEKHAIQIFICLAAVDNEVHLKALASLTKILSNKEKLEALLLASSQEEIYQIITKGEEE